MTITGNEKIILVLLALLLVVVMVLLIKTWTYNFETPQPAMEQTENISYLPSPEAIRRFAGGIRIPTVSTEVYEDTDFRPFDEFKTYLADVYPRVNETMETETVNTYGLVFRWKGKNPNLKPILFLSHYDMVPVAGYDPDQYSEDNDFFLDPEEAFSTPLDEISEQWDYPPFSGAVARGRIYGRGTLDMKCMLFSLMEGAETLIAEGFQSERDIWFAFGHDEEVGGRQGALQIAAMFRERGLSFDAVYDEGGIIAAPGAAMESIQKPLALVGTGEKGFLTLRLRVKGLGGHSSMPPAKSSLVYAAEIIERLNTEQIAARIIPPIASFLDHIGSQMSFLDRMTIANQWIMKPLLIRNLEKTPASNALVRTTTAITMARGSDAANVLASVAEITVNFRILPGDSVAGVIQHVQDICQDYEVDIEVVSEREPSGISSESTRGFEIIREKIGRLYPDAIVSSYITIGGTDSYKYQTVSEHIYRFLPMQLNTFEQRTIHNENEHISLENYGKMLWYFQEIMSTF
ncbi:MAG: M20/M25/M40 family metallo-hydrolase [Rikenellaceae bacterium]|nr:M20/M25/M40 family metallo-hydrolase [Rikenellaceae bacterium]